MSILSTEAHLRLRPFLNKSMLTEATRTKHLFQREYSKVGHVQNEFT